jgi:tetratricopeptide (TPR) repeat protein
MKFQKQSFRLIIIIMIMSVLITACSSAGIGQPTPTEIEIIFDPAELVTEVPTQAATATLRPTVTPTLEPTEGPTIEPSPTNTLDPFNTLIFEGNELMLQEDFDAAVAKFTEAIQMDPASPLGYYHRGRAYTATGKFDDAITDLNFSLNYDPNYALALNARGVAWAQKGQNAQAIIDFTKAVEMDPELIRAYTNRGIAYMNQENMEEAEKDFQKVVELDPDNPESKRRRSMKKLSMLILLVIVASLLVAAIPTKMMRLTIINKSGYDVYMKLEGSAVTDAYYYLTVPAGDRDEPTVKVFTVMSDAYTRTTWQCDGLKSDGYLVVDGNIRLTFVPCGEFQCSWKGPTYLVTWAAALMTYSTWSTRATTCRASPAWKRLPTGSTWPMVSPAGHQLTAMTATGTLAATPGTGT